MKRKVGQAYQGPIPGEAWRPIVGFEAYQVSDKGRVRSFANDMCVILAAGRHTKGYMTVRLSLGERGAAKNFLVHRLVLEAFVGAKPSGLQAGHKDGDRTNNALSNLCWRSAKEAHLAQKERGTLLVGEKNHKAKLNEFDVEAIKTLLTDGTSATLIADVFAVSGSAISDIKHGVTWNPNADDFSRDRAKARARPKENA